ncbi:COX15/CtaA family protein [Lysinibacter sp. HNR]|uniref:COX15/CtaA family protein n=1 Tax=Lysinibacter sp. HNR TaxID=3031408 RepID=UPI0024348D7C|nr:COX15/CtaA family protein [Lysinibacter sp. HNR]WGD36193.1 COX15/CtaA family protein [Lysinibacter sp. HNR]
MSNQTVVRPSKPSSFWTRLPDRVDKRVRVIAWLSLISQVGIVATGGAVRLTASGLGCATWPRCNGDSWVATPESEWHGMIEFGNRLLTFVLTAIAIVAFLYVIRFRKQRPDLFWLTFSLGMGIPAQAVIGGITVLTGLNPYIVGLHFILSAALVVLATVFVYNVYHGRGRGLLVDPLVAGLAWLVALASVVSVVLGVLTTGAGPHAGHDGKTDDAPVMRNGLDAIVMQHLHSYPGYIMLGLIVLLLIFVIIAKRRRSIRYTVGLLAVTVVQVIVGVAQARLGLPELLVGIHMVLACVTLSAVTAVLLTLRTTEGQPPQPGIKP